MLFNNFKANPILFFLLYPQIKFFAKENGQKKQLQYIVSYAPFRILKSLELTDPPLKKKPGSAMMHLIFFHSLQLVKMKSGHGLYTTMHLYRKRVVPYILTFNGVLSGQNIWVLRISFLLAAGKRLKKRVSFLSKVKTIRSRTVTYSITP